MTAHVLRLAMGEWHKVRRRWIPWILLGLIILVSQGVLWGFYAGYHISDDPFGSLVPPYEYRDSEGVIVVTCADVAEGRGEGQLALIAERFPEDGREELSAEMTAWVGTCEGYLTPDEARGAFTLPYSLGVAEGIFPLFVIPVLILAATVMGVEYGWGTLRATLTRGVGRWQLLSGKLVMLMAVTVGMVILIGVVTGVSSILAGVVPPGEDGSLVAGERQAWLDAFEGLGKLMFALAPYVALGAFLAVLTQSTAQGIALSLGYYVLEMILAPLLGSIADWLERVLEAALLGQNVGEWLTSGYVTDAQQSLGVAADQPDTIRAFFVVLAYIAALVAAAVWLFQRRDVTGAKGE